MPGLETEIRSGLSRGSFIEAGLEVVYDVIRVGLEIRLWSWGSGYVSCYPIPLTFPLNDQIVSSIPYYLIPFPCRDILLSLGGIPFTVAMTAVPLTAMELEDCFGRRLVPIHRGTFDPAFASVTAHSMVDVELPLEVLLNDPAK